MGLRQKQRLVGYRTFLFILEHTLPALRGIRRQEGTGSSSLPSRTWREI